MPLGPAPTIPIRVFTGKHGCSFENCSSTDLTGSIFSEYISNLLSLKSVEITWQPQSQQLSLHAYIIQPFSFNFQFRQGLPIQKNFITQCLKAFSNESTKGSNGVNNVTRRQITREWKTDSWETLRRFWHEAQIYST